MKILFKIIDSENRYIIGSTKSTLKIKFKNLKSAQARKPDPLSPLADPECEIELIRELDDDADMKMSERYEIIKAREYDGTCLNRLNPIFGSEEDFTPEQTAKMDMAKNSNSRWVLRSYYANRDRTLRYQALRKVRLTGVVCLTPGTIARHQITPEEIQQALDTYIQNN